VVNPAENSGVPPVDLPPLSRLLLAYAPPQLRLWHRLCWLLDQRLAAVVRRGGDPTIAAIRLAWWDAVLVEQDAGKGGGEPLVEQWRAIAPEGSGARAERLIDGWRMLASPDPMGAEDLATYAAARGGGLFSLLAAGSEQDEAVARAGRQWALWDLAGHVRDKVLAGLALEVARAQGSGAAPSGAALKPLRLAQAIARPDIAAGKVPDGGFSLRHYGRLLLASLRG
jgi:hypothetical protein